MAQCSLQIILGCESARQALPSAALGVMGLDTGKPRPKRHETEVVHFTVQHYRSAVATLIQSRHAMAILAAKEAGIRFRGSASRRIGRNTLGRALTCALVEHERDKRFLPPILA